jgi:ribonuclease III
VLPAYTIAEDGPDHEKRFTAAVLVDGEVLGGGEGRSKKEAEQQAAAEAYRVLVARLGRPAGDRTATDGENPSPQGRKL